MFKIIYVYLCAGFLHYPNFLLASFPNFDNILTCKVSGSCDFDSIYKDGINNRCVNEDCFVTNDFEGDIKNAQELLMTVNYTKGTLKLVLYFRGWNGYDLWLSDYNLIEAIAEVDGVERHLDPILITLMQLHNGILEQKLKLELRDTSGKYTLSLFLPPPPHPSLVGEHNMQPPSARAIFLDYDLLPFITYSQIYTAYVTNF